MYSLFDDLSSIHDINSLLQRVAARAVQRVDGFRLRAVRGAGLADAGGAGTLLVPEEDGIARPAFGDGAGAKAEAVYLLLHTDLSITQIAVRLHFADTPTFTKFFVKMKGVNPKKFRTEQ
ncbi:MAG: helix-turn-helix domain-containing protein [Prevotella sp.]|nr:helix-turn-helix domain-containing protein [Prevotella sp.]